MTTLQLVVALGCLAAAAGLGVLVALDRLPGRGTLAVLGVLEVGLLGVTVAGLLRLGGPAGDTSVATYVAYLLGILLLLPVAARLAWVEHGRVRGAVLIVALLIAPVLLLRIEDIWRG